MSTIRQWFAMTMVILPLAACSAVPTPRQLAEDAVAAMGGREQLQGVRTIVLQGGGSRTRLGQALKRGDPEEPAQLTNLVETVDLANGLAAHEYDVQRPGFMQHRREVIASYKDQPIGIETVAGATIVTSVSGLFSWAAHNSPEGLLRRNLVSIVLAATESANADQAAEDREFNGKMCKFGTARTESDEEIDLYFNPESKLLEGFELTDTETMLGDVPAQYALSDYRSVNGIMLPYRVTIRKQGEDYADIQYTAITVNDPGAANVFAIPESLRAEAENAFAVDDYTPMRLNPVAPGVYHALAFRHHSLIVEFPTYVVVVEAPYTEAQSKVLMRQIEAQIPGKPVRYAVVTHPHFDHTGGVRGIAALGATIVAEKRHEPDLRQLLDTPHTHPADALQTRGNYSLEVFDNKHVITDGGQSLELYAITGSEHVDPMVIAYVPGPRVLFQSDLFFPGTGAASPFSAHLLESIKNLNLRVNTMVGGHGGTGPFAELVTGVAAAPASN